MDTEQLETRIVARAGEFLAGIGGEVPSIFRKNWWVGRVMDWCMRNEEFKGRLFSFIDVLPSLSTAESLDRHIHEYFASAADVPAVLRWGLKGASLGGRFGKRMAAETIRSNIRSVARNFIIASDLPHTVQRLTRLRKRGFAFTLDFLGEATVSESEADTYAARYFELLDKLAEAQANWPPLGGNGDEKLDWGDSPKVNVSVKPSALFSQARPVDFAGSVEGILVRLKGIYRKVVEIGGFLCIDMEMRKLKNITLEIFRRLRGDDEFRDCPHLGLAVQTYLRETDGDVDRLLAWARREQLPISIRLVKGAYWDYENDVARRSGWPAQVYTVKSHTDAALERNAAKILRNHDICHLGCASHNVRSVSAVMETARGLGVPDDRYEFQVLYGMAEPFRKALLRLTPRVRLYCPCGELIEGMAYLIRRLIENTSNESFLRQEFVEGVDLDRLLGRPEDEPADAPPPAPVKGEPLPDWSNAEVRSAYAEAIDEVRRNLGKTCTLLIDGREVTTDDIAESVNPAHPDEVIAHVCQAGIPELDLAVDAAQKALGAWRDTPPPERAEYLIKAAQLARGRVYELAAWQTLEAGHPWPRACLDVTRAINGLEVHARITPISRGIVAVVASSNSPPSSGLAICTAAVATGACVLYKPPRFTPVASCRLIELFRDAGLPPGVLNFMPGRNTTIDDYLAAHPEVTKLVAESVPDGTIIVDDDANLDLAIPAVIASACSRVIVVDGICDRFVERLIAAARSMKIGAPEDPTNSVGPLIDTSARDRFLDHIRLAGKEGTIVFSSDIPGEGFYAPITISVDTTPEDRIAQEQVAGPFLAVMRAADFPEALRWAKRIGSDRAITVFTRSPAHAELARKESGAVVGSRESDSASGVIP